MRIIFMGSPDFAIPSLVELYKSEHEVAAVVSNVDKRRGRRSKPTPTPVKAKALELDLPVIEVEELGAPSFYRELESLQADLFVVVAFRVLPVKLLEVPKRGSINLHASLLPKYRGAAPIHWAIMNGETETGCTIFFLDEKVDTGLVIKKQKTSIGPNETTGELYERLKNLGSKLLVQAVDAIGRDSYKTTPQNHDKASPAPKLFTGDCKIGFNKPAPEVHNKIRGLSPFPTAWAKLDGQKFNMYRSEIGPDKELAPGQIITEDSQLIVGCSPGTLKLIEVQMEGKRRMNGIDFMNGYSGPGLLR